MAENDGGGVGGDEETLLVGVKLDARSKELLTWSMVKLAKPGDHVIALHVMGNNEIVDQDGKSSLLSVVNEFDSVLAVYEGFCNLKQVDLKLKVCRGSSIRKVLVREAKSYNANKLIVGIASKHHTIRSSYSVAKYCARKLSKECSVLAVHNGKVMFQREASRHPAKIQDAQVANEDLRNGSLSMVNQASSTGLNLSNVGGKESREDLERALSMVTSNCTGLVLKDNCRICKPDHDHSENSLSGKQEEEETTHILSGDGSMAVVLDEPEASNSNSVNLLVKDFPAKRPGWPLQKTLLSEIQEDTDSSALGNNHVVQQAIQLPSGDTASDTNSVVDPLSIDEEDETSDLEVENSCLVPYNDTEDLPTSQNEHSSRRLLVELESLHAKYSSTCRLFKYEELQVATSYFASENLIGRGGSSKVYRGCLSDGKELAVKILKSSEGVLKEFVQEIEIITSVHHKNIISLLGFCFEDKNLLLVYDLLPRGSLEENLHGSKKDPQTFGWNERYKVAVGVAEAINYLHNVTSRSIIHRDVKSSNILLSDDFEPQLSDFGLAKWVSSSSLKAYTDIAGTFGYLAPEYFMYGKVTEKIDVYAYGVVLLELLSGRKPISNNHPKGQESLILWAKPMLNGGNIAPLLDSSLGLKYNVDEMERMVLTANLCIRRSPRARPKMSLVLKLIQGDAEVMKWARLQVNTTDNSDRTHCGEGFHQNSSSVIQSHINLALLDVVEDDSVSVSSLDQNVSLEDYLRGRWSRSSSFNYAL